MGHFKGNGGTATIVAGQTQYWEYSNGLDDGIAYAAPNLAELNTHIELIAEGQGITERPAGGDGVLIVYTVRIQANGVGEISYNLNIEDWE